MGHSTLGRLGLVAAVVALSAVPLEAQAPADTLLADGIAAARLLAVAPVVAAQDVAAAADDGEHRIVNFTIYAAGASAFGDAVTTAWARGSGCCDEQNDLVRWATDNPIPWAIVKGATDVAVVYLLIKNRKRHPVAVALAAIAYTSLQVALTRHNYQQWQAHRR